jgi:hypothetical protein
MSRTTDAHVADAELTLLRSALQSAEGTAAQGTSQLKILLTNYRDGGGKDPAPVIAQIATISGQVQKMSSELRGVPLSSPAASHARTVVLQTLTAMAGAFGYLRASMTAHSTGAAQHALQSAKTQLAQVQSLQKQASQALGFNWKL